MTSSLTATDRPAEISASWGQACLPRAGKSDLRFAGRRLFWLDRPCESGPNASIALWEQKKGGYALGWTTFHDGQIVPQAVVLASLSDVMDHLEDTCASLGRDPITCPDDLSTSQFSLLAFISDVKHRASFQRSFTAIASEALSVWDVWQRE